jgi:cyclophilin family peptidyl-prolyl cis-trans isomerase
MTLRPPARSFVLLASFASFLLVAAGCSRDAAPQGAAATGAPSGPLFAVMETDKGPIEIELLPAVAPKTVENFRILAQRGYYDGLTFHRIVKGFMIQGGDPTGTGRGGESAWGGMFEDEIDRRSPLYREGYKRGSVAMANAGPNTNTSQFFIVHQDYPLPPSYTIFGKVTKGMEVVDALADTQTTLGADGGKSRPVTPPTIRKVTLRQ